MLGLILRRFLQMFLVLLVASLTIFVLLRLTPGDPAEALLGPNASDEGLAAIRHKLALDRPLYFQYGTWVWNVFHFDLGTSIFSGQPVATLIAARLPATLQLAVGGILILVVFGTIVGVVSAALQGGKADTVITGVTSLIIGMPAFWIGLLAIILFALELHWLPSGGWVDIFTDPIMGLRSLAMPCLVLGVVEGSVFARFVRSSTSATLTEDYITTARAKGVPTSVVLVRHAFRNGLIPVVTVLGLIIGSAVGGAVILEIVFAWPGIGRLLVDSVDTRDYPVIQGVLLLLIFSFVFINLLVDLAYAVIDPRARV